MWYKYEFIQDNQSFSKEEWLEVYLQMSLKLN
jgi:hypothetical protein